MSHTLATRRISLRPPEPSDAQFFIDLYGDPEVMQFIPPTRVPMDSEKALNRLSTLLEHWEIHGFGMYVIEEKKSKTPLGYCGLRYLEEVDAIELGSILGKSAWGKGIGPEAAKLCIDYARDVLKADELITLTDPDNARSQKVIKRLGFERCEELDGVYHNTPHFFFVMHFGL